LIRDFPPLAPAISAIEVEVMRRNVVNNHNVAVIRGTQVVINRQARRNHPGEPVVLSAR
jgi:hypothetical protein